MELTSTFMVLLEHFRPVFGAPTFATFRLLMTGWILSVRHRYVTDLIISSDSVGNGHFSDYHRFFSHAKWEIDQLWQCLARAIVNQLVGPDGVILLAGDDTLCRKRGLGLFGAGMHHDPLISSKAMKLVSWGHDWVNLCVLIVNPWWAPSKVFALPICMRLYRNKQGVTKGQKKDKRQSRSSSQSPKASKKAKKRIARKTKRVAARQQKKRGAAKTPRKTTLSAHRTRPELMREMLEMVATWFPERQFLFVGDSLYTGKSILSYLPENMDMIGAVHPTGVMYEPAPKIQTGRGRRRKKGERLSSRDEWGADGTGWRKYKFDQYGLHGAFETKTRKGLYYAAGKDRTLKFVLTRDTKGQRPTQIFYCTNLDMRAKEILATYSHRWAIEVTHYDAKQQLGLEDPANRVPKAVERTAPMAMFLYSLTIVWFHQHGHKKVKFPERPWYKRKSEPSFRDMLTTLRKETWREKLSRECSPSTPSKNPIDLLIFQATLAG